MDAKWFDGALCGACDMAVEFVVKVIAVVRAAGCWSDCWRERKVLAGVVVQDLPKFSVSTSDGLTVVLWKSTVVCY